MRYLPVLFAPLAGLLFVAQPALCSPHGTTRLETIKWTAGLPETLAIMPGTALTVLFEPGEQIKRVLALHSNAVGVRVSPAGDSIILVPSGDDFSANLIVDTTRRSYPLLIKPASGTSALVVRFDTSQTKKDGAGVSPLANRPAPGPVWSYRLRGDRSVRPVSIKDDGHKTYIKYAPNQALPAVFAEGPSHHEQSVNGYMRGGVYVLERVHQKLVFRIDKERATAERDRKPDSAK